MSSFQVTIGGAAVNASPGLAAGYAGPPAVQPGVGQFNVLNAAGSAFVVPNTAIPASGASVTVGNFVVRNTGGTTAVGGGTQPLLSIQVLSGQAPAAGLNYQINAASGAPNYTTFDAVAPLVAPNAPTGMTGTAGYAPTQVAWSWTAPADGPAPDSYNLYTGQYPGTETLRQSGITALSFTDTSVVKGRPTSAYVRAVAGGIEGPPSLRFVLTVLDQPMPCQNCPPINSY